MAETKIKVELHSIVSKLGEDANSCVHFFYHLVHYLDQEVGACRASYATKAAKALDQAASMLRQASFRIALSDQTEDTDNVDSQYDKRARYLAQYCVNNKNTLAKLLLLLEKNIVNKDEALHGFLKAAALFVRFGNKVQKRTTVPRWQRKKKAKRPG